MDVVYDNYEKHENDTFNRNQFTIDFDDLPPFLAFVCVVGLLTNGALLFVLRKTNVRDAPNSLIFSLAVADILVISFVLPVIAAANAAPSYPFNEAVCKLTTSLNVTMAGVSAFSLPALAAFCYLGGRETTLPRGRSEWNVAIAVVWALAVAMAVPTMITANLVQFDKFNAQLLCYSDEEIFLDSWVAFKFAAYVVIPLAAVGYFYGIARGNCTADAPQAQRDFSRVTLVLVFVYAVCIVPEYVVDLCIFFTGVYGNVWHALGLSGYCLGFAYRCLNPIALYCASDTFRRLFDRHLFCRCTSSNREQHVVGQMSLRDSSQNAALLYD